MWHCIPRGSWVVNTHTGTFLYNTARLWSPYSSGLHYSWPCVVIPVCVFSEISLDYRVECLTVNLCVLGMTGRVAMLAFAGLVVQEFVHLPGDLYSEPNAIKAFYQVCQAGRMPSIFACNISSGARKVRSEPCRLLVH